MARYKRRTASATQTYSPLESFRGRYDFEMCFINAACEEQEIKVRAEYLPLRHLAKLGWPDRLIAAFQGGVVKVSLFKSGAKKPFWHTYLPVQFYRDLAQTLEGLSLDGRRMGKYMP